jgi:hypothetical protein
MRTARIVGRTIAAGVTVAAMVPGPLLGDVSAVRAGPNTFVEVTPNTAQGGTRVNLRASCESGNNQMATVQSEAFGRVALRPDNGFLTGSVTVPGNKAPGAYAVNLSCQNGHTATTTLTVVNMSQGSQGPATGGGGTAGGPGGMLMLIGGIGVIALGAGFGLAGRQRRRTEPGS